MNINPDPGKSEDIRLHGALHHPSGYGVSGGVAGPVEFLADAAYVLANVAYYAANQFDRALQQDRLPWPSELVAPPEYAFQPRPR